MFQLIKQVGAGKTYVGSYVSAGSAELSGEGAVNFVPAAGQV